DIFEIVLYPMVNEGFLGVEKGMAEDQSLMMLCCSSVLASQRHSVAQCDGAELVVSEKTSIVSPTGKDW
ncbi:hypothetical protein GCK32_021432, partial [Trichostrongylus colubriformis]